MQDKDKDYKNVAKQEEAHVCIAVEKKQLCSGEKYKNNSEVIKTKEHS